MHKRFLITGGTGKTGCRLTQYLVREGHSCLVASRSGRGIAGQRGLQFDWGDANYYRGNFEGIDGIYLLAPPVTSQLSLMKPFIQEAQKRGVQRFVLLSASSLPEAGPMMGEVHEYLKANTSDWAVLRPTWFMQNFSEQQHLPTIRNSGVVYSATGEGVVPFIDVEDIAHVAGKLLMASQPMNRDLILTGPKLLSYDEVAKIIGEAVNRPIRHVKLSANELARRFKSQGLSEHYSRILAEMDSMVAKGGENRITGEVERIVGRPPIHFEAFARRVKDVWVS